MEFCLSRETGLKIFHSIFAFFVAHQFLRRYPICHKPFRKAREHLLGVVQYDIKNYLPFAYKEQKPSDYAPPVENPEFCKELEDAKIDFSLDFDDRFFRCRGQSIREQYVLRFGQFKRIPDIVVWPKCHEEVEFIVKLANKYLSVIIPIGGGTNVTMALSYTNEENKKFFISLDTTLMNRILWIDRKSMLACIESGIVGQDMEAALNLKSLTMGHEPDSLEFSTLGGWIATRASGMKQQTYGNIESMISRVSLVTSVGTLEKNYQAPRTSIGPDFDHVIMGSEGTLGVITNVVVKLHPKPPVRRCGSIMFPDFESGTKFLFDVSKFRTKPSSLRLMDNIHFKFGQALQQNESVFGSIMDQIRKSVATGIFRYDMNKVAMAIYLIEGEKSDVDAIEKQLKSAAWKFWGVDAGAKYGDHSYLMTLTVCYFRVNLKLFIAVAFLTCVCLRIFTWTWDFYLTPLSLRCLGRIAGH